MKKILYGIVLMVFLLILGGGCFPVVPGWMTSAK
jgi:hypothetical protein